MKKNKIILLILFIIIFSSCKGKNNSSTNVMTSFVNSMTSTTSSISTNNTLSSSSSSINYTKLATPVVTLDELTGIVSWNSINNADYYSYIVNGTNEYTTTNTNLKLEDGQNISICAMSNTNEFLPSDFSNAISYIENDVIIVPAGYSSVYFYDTNFSTISIKNGSLLSKPNDPSKSNYIFDNWYADIYYSKLFDFSEPIINNTIIYAKYNPIELINSIYYWIKADANMTSTVQSSSSSWRFIPLKLNTSQTNYKEFSATVTVNSVPCEFLITDGFESTTNRLYWKYNGNNFIINSIGTYTIYFSTEHQWKDNDIYINAYIAKLQTASSLLYVNTNSKINKLATPLITISNNSGIVSWSKVTNAIKYGYIINNGPMAYTNDFSININYKDFITVIAIGDNDNYSNSNWSNTIIRYQIIEGDQPTIDYYYVFFYEADLPCVKVNNGDKISKPINPTKKGFKFVNWYSDFNRTILFDFNQTIEKNTVIYAKWEILFDWKTHEFFYIFNSSNTKLTGLIINQNVNDYNEYYGTITITSATNIIIKDRDGIQSFGPYQLTKASTYTIYFSDEHLWRNNSHIYVMDHNCNIYFTNAISWSKVYAYAYLNSTVNNASWPGVEMTYVKTNNYNQKIYRIVVDLSKYKYIIFSNGSGAQVVTISLDYVQSEQGYYSKETMTDGRYNYGTFTYS